MGTWQIILNTQWLWTTLAWVLPFLAAVVLLWALFRDRPGLWGVPRERCPKCRYDMAGRGNAETPIVCPECGKAIRDGRSLRKTRRRWGMALLAVPLLVGWHLVERKDEIRTMGWVSAVPTPVLMAIVAPDDWFDRLVVQGMKPTTLPEHLQFRLMQNDMAMRVWLLCSRDFLDREGLSVIDATDLARVQENLSVGGFQISTGQTITRVPILDNGEAEQVAEFVVRTIDPESWIENGGEWHWMYTAGPFLLPRAGEDVVHSITALTDLLRRARAEGRESHVSRIQGRGFRVVSFQFFAETGWYREIEASAIEFADDPNWRWNGGGISYRDIYRGHFDDAARYGAYRARQTAYEIILLALMYETNTELWIEFGGELFSADWIGEILVIHSEHFSPGEFQRTLERIRDLGPDAILKKHGVQP